MAIVVTNGENMVRIFIRNGICAVEKFFKMVGSDSKVIILKACYQKPSFTVKEMGVLLDGKITEPVLTKRLLEFTNSTVVDKIVYNQQPGRETVFRITQKGVDTVPIFGMMRTFHKTWSQTEDDQHVCWTTYTKTLLGSRWNARILWLLHVLRSMRFNELKNSIEGISFKMLTQQLRYLESEGVVLKTDFQESPPHTEYSLTEKGEALYNILIAVSSWVTKYERTKEADMDECSLHLSI